MRKPAGFTLIEVIIATSLIAVLIGAFLQLLTTQARVASEESQDTSAQSGLIITTEAILPLLEEAKLIDIVNIEPSEPLAIRFHVPVKDFNGKVETFPSTVTGKVEVKLGAGQPGAVTQGNYFELSFQPGYDTINNVGRPDELIDEATTRNSYGVNGVDFNKDGDTTDKFMYGTMILRQFTSAGVYVADTERNLGGRVAVAWPDGAIFEMSGPTVANIRLLSLDIRVKPEDSRIRTASTRVRLRGEGKP